ncbi:aldolase/citrate lyase family protein [Tistrella bauzanensis]
MTLRSWLFVPADSERKLARSDDSAADALILDLEDAVAPARKADARRCCGFPDGAAARRAPLSALGPDQPLDDTALADLCAIMPGAPDGVVVPKVNGPADVVRLSHWLDAFEAAAGLPAGSTSILPVATETPAAPFALGDYARQPLPGSPV